MNIIIVTHYCIPHIGGVEALSFDQAKALAKNGHEVTIFSSRTHHEELREEKIEGVNFIRINVSNFLEEIYGIPYPIFAPNFLLELYRQLSITDICIVHGFGFMSSFIAALLCKLRNIPYLVIHNNEFVQYQSSLLNVIEHFNDYSLGRIVLLNAAEIMAVSSGTREYLIRLGGRNVDILNNFVDPVLFCPSSNRDDYRKILGIPHNKVVIITCCRLVYKKGINVFLQVAQQLASDSRFFFIIVGDGPERSELEKFVSLNHLTNCSFTGKIDRQLVAKYYQASDIFVLPSNGGEGWPVAVLEAMASGLPVILTRTGGPEEILQDKINCFFVDLKAPGQIVTVLEGCVQRTEILSKMGHRGREIVLEKFSIEHHVEELLTVINQMAATKHIDMPYDKSAQV